MSTPFVLKNLIKLIAGAIHSFEIDQQMNEWISRWVGDIDKGISGLGWVNEGMQIWMDGCMHAWMDGLVGKDKCSHKKSL